LKTKKFPERIGHAEIRACRRKYSLKEQNTLHSQNAGRYAIEVDKMCRIYGFQRERFFDRRRYARLTEYRKTVFERTRYSIFI
jgi:hypothetical protein